MGLDMYLTSKLYLGGHFGFNRITGTVDLTQNEKPVEIDLSRLDKVVFHEAYWRKANQIHKWFVDNCQGGKDECQEAYVSREQLEELRDLCKRVLAESKLVKGQVENGQKWEEGEWVPVYVEGEYIEDPAIAEELLPSQSGFLFGGTGYDQWYVADLKNTIEQIDEALKRNEGKTTDFYYRASW